MLQQNRLMSFESSAANPGTQEAAFQSLGASAEGLRQWIRNSPQVAIFGAILLGAGLGWILKERT